MRRTKADKLGELEDQIKGLERRTDELRAERDAANALIGRMRESIETAQSMVESFVYSFDMQERADGVLEWSEDCWEDKYYELLSDWNKFVPQYNAVVAPRLRNFGRPLLASDAQRDDVLKRHRARQSLRSIADDTELSLRTVRTIIDKRDRLDRSSVARLKRTAPEVLADLRARRKERKTLPRRVTALKKETAKLLKEAKGHDH